MNMGRESGLRKPKDFCCSFDVLLYYDRDMITKDVPQVLTRMRRGKTSN
jgi:hypothetical protein